MNQFKRAFCVSAIIAIEVLPFFQISGLSNKRRVYLS